MIQFNTIVNINLSLSRKRRVASQTSTTAEEQLSLLRSSVVLDTTSAEILIDQAGSVVITDLTLNNIGETDKVKSSEVECTHSVSRHFFHYRRRSRIYRN